MPLFFSASLLLLYFTLRDMEATGLIIYIAGMYVKGISARKMNVVQEKLCGLQISSSQVRWANCS
jgi:transposase-like protein